MASNKLRELVSLIDVQVSTCQAELRQVRLREERLYALLQDLDVKRGTSPTSGQVTAMHVFDFQNDIRQRRWIDQRRTSVNTELAQIRALMSIHQEQLAHHFSRQQALAALAKQEHASAAKRVTRRTFDGY